MEPCLRDFIFILFSPVVVSIGINIVQFITIQNWYLWTGVAFNRQFFLLIYTFSIG